MTTGIYQIKNTNNGKVYIGSSVDINRRWREHRNRLRSKQHKNLHLLRAWEKHGEDAFEFSIIYEVDNTDELIPHEQWCLDIFEPEYNNSTTAGKRAFLGKTHTPETRAKFSGTNHPMYGKRHTPECIELMSAARKGKGTGSTHPNAILTDEKVLLARWLFGIDEKYTQTWLADYFGISITAMHLVVRNKAWKHLEEMPCDKHPDYGKRWPRQPHSEETKRRISKSKGCIDRQAVLDLCETGQYNQREIADIFNVDPSYISHIVCRRKKIW